ncbi:MAG: histidine phosphatase family protein [Patescibacteria group bacterium]|nr:histidine phosphatase family protein [Patescibacteria group bacterium]
MQERATVYVLQRHLESTAAKLRRDFLIPHSETAKIPQLQRIHHAIGAVRGKHITLKEAKEITQNPQMLADLAFLQPILDQFAKLPSDPDLPLVNGETQKGKQIGIGLKHHLETSGRRIDVAETSPFTRAYLTAESVLSTADQFHDNPTRRVPLQINPLLRERLNGREVEKVADRAIYLAKHPEELVKWARNPDTYRFPGKNVETANEAKKRVRKTVNRMKRASKDEGKVIYLSTHSEMIGEVLSQLRAKPRNIDTGTITIIEATHRTWGQRIFRRSRRLKVSETIDFTSRV